jgi:hypothetical protein
MSMWLPQPPSEGGVRWIATEQLRRRPRARVYCESPQSSRRVCAAKSAPQRVATDTNVTFLFSAPGGRDSGLADCSFMLGSINLGTYDNSDFDRGAPTWKRGPWVVVRCVFFQNPCPWESAFRSALLRAFGAKIGKGVGIGSNVNISFPWRLIVGDHVWIGDDVGILSLAQVTIESNVCVARRSFLCTARHDLQKF